MTIKLDGTTLVNSGLGTTLTNEGHGYLTNDAALTNENGANLINVGVHTTLTNENGSTLTNTGATLLNVQRATLTNTGAGTVLINENNSTLVNGATLDNLDSATLTNSATLVNDGTINNSASFDDTATGRVLGTGSFIQTAGGVTEIDGSFTQGALKVKGGTFTVNGPTTITGDASDAGNLTITANNTLTVHGTFTTSGSGNLTIDSGATLDAGKFVEKAGTVVLNNGTIDPTAVELQGGTLSGSGALIGDVVNKAEITAAGGTLDIQGKVTGNGTLAVGSGATLELDSKVGGGNTLQFTANTGVAQIDDLLNGVNNQQFNASISDFAPGDGLDFAVAGLGTFGDITSAMPGTYDASTGTTALMLDDGGSLVATLTMEGDYSGTTFTVSQASGFVDVGAVCYCPGTLIETERGQTRVEDLKIGDEVMTMSGAVRPIKWIGRRSYNGRFAAGQKNILPVCIKAGALDANVPRRDLWISPHHAMYIDGVLIEAKDLVNGASIVQAERADKVDYFHIELETHDVIIAEGALAESFVDDDSRGIFHNAHDYSALYPEAVTGTAQYYAPRLEHGYEVEAIRQRIALRAGLVLADKRIGQLRGQVNRVSDNCIAGWAQNADHPEAPVCLDIYAGGQLIGQVLANRYREDLERQDLGSGRHSFEFTLPPELAFIPDEVEVRRSLDGVALEFANENRRLQRESATHDPEAGRAVA